jgi:elongation factor G
VHVKEIATGSIRNVALVAHHGVGKTTLAEAMLFQAGAASRIGRVAEGTTMLDHSPEEIARQITIDLGLAQFDFQGHRINLLDTPGYSDFVGDVYSALRVADSAILMLRAAAGVEVGTEVVWEVLKQERSPLLVVVNMMDKEHADFDAAIRSCHERLGLNAVPAQLPIGEGEAFHGVVDLIENRAYTFTGKGADERSQEVPIPAEMAERVARARATLLEEAATGDETLMERFLSTGELTVPEIRRGLCERVVMGDLAPAFCCAASLNLGVKEVLEEVIDVLPGPGDVRPQRGTLDGREVEVAPDTSAPFSATVFKTLAENHLGELSLMRLWSGHLAPGQDAVNTTRGRTEKLGTLYQLCGRERSECRGAAAGDIVAAVKLRETHTGDTLADRARAVKLAPPDFPVPVAFECIRARNKGDEEKMAVGLMRLHEEDPTLSRHYEESTRESLVQGMGDLHLEVLVERMRKRFGVEVVLSKPHVPYRETIRGRAEGEYRHKKQSGGRGQFGEVHLRLAPLTRGTGFEFVNEVKGGVIPGQYIPAVEKGVVAGMERGPLAGFPVVDVKATVFFGKYHDVDSSEMAFKIASEACFHERMLEAQPVLLEPFSELEIRVPEEFLGDVMGDLSGKRGRILGTEAEGHDQVVRAKVPMAETYKYATHLRALTQGRGRYRASLSHYEEVPRELADKVIATARAEREALAAQHA